MHTFGFSISVYVCVCRTRIHTHTHMHVCTHARTWEFIFVCVHCMPVHMLAHGSYIYMCACVCVEKNVSTRYCSSGTAHLELTNIANWLTSEHWEPFHHLTQLSLHEFYSSHSCPYACIATVLVTDPHLIFIDEMCLLGLYKNPCVYSTNIP